MLAPFLLRLLWGHRSQSTKSVRSIFVIVDVTTSPIPSKGATSTASVRTARPTLRPVSIDCCKSPVNSCIIFADSLAIAMEADSRSRDSNKI